MAPSFFLLFLILLVMLAKEVESQNTSFKIDVFTVNSLLLAYEGDAFVAPDTGYVQLTAVNGSGYPLDYSVGRVLYKAPVKLWELVTQASFETTITLRITNTRKDYFNAAGMTFFMVPVNSTLPDSGTDDNIGIYDQVFCGGNVLGANVFAVEFDIYGSTLDSKEPIDSHIGININSMISQKTTNFPDYSGELVTARITYDAQTKMISVVATYGSKVAEVSFPINLKAFLPQEVQVGLSASTGEYLANIDAFTWHFNSTLAYIYY